MLFTKNRQKQFDKLINDVENLSDKFSTTFSSINEEQLSIVQRIQSLEDIMSDYIKQKSRKESDEPFINIISEDFDANNGIELKIDWNDSMISFLKRNGYHGSSDDEIVEKYIYDLFKNRNSSI